MLTQNITITIFVLAPDKYWHYNQPNHKEGNIMPLTLTVTEGVLPEGQERNIFKGLCDLMLKHHGILGNKVMTPNVVGSLHIIPENHTFTGGDNDKVAFIEWKVPSFVFSDRKTQCNYINEATNLIFDSAKGQLPKNHIWVNVIHAADGAWGINGEAMTNEELKEAISQG